MNKYDIQDWWYYMEKRVKSKADACSWCVARQACVWGQLPTKGTIRRWNYLDALYSRVQKWRSEIP